MQDHDRDSQGSHGGMNHGMGMMMLGCVIPMAAIYLLPRIGVSAVAALAVGIGGMVVFHVGMAAVQHLKNRRPGHAVDSIAPEHHHQH